MTTGETDCYESTAEEAACSECGAALVDSQSCEVLFHTCLALEFGEPAYGAVHNLTVPAYYLQHPSLLSRRGWEEVRATLSAFLVDGVSVGEMRRRATETLDSGQRDFSFRTGEPMNLVDTIWSRTIGDIRLDDAENYRADIRHWAQAVLDDLSQYLPRKQEENLSE
ncbi:MAG: hypothetical protein KF753_02130 [Caldilineaceae bacterium]|nr:hypothetical protein [Caldilineaceae bacterium]